MNPYLKIADCYAVSIVDCRCIDFVRLGGKEGRRWR